MHQDRDRLRADRPARQAIACRRMSIVSCTVSTTLAIEVAEE